MIPDSPEIAAIKMRYQQSFADKAVVVEQHLAAHLGASEDPISLQDTREMLHKLAGSSGMYEYNDISSVCRSSMSRIDEQDTTALINRLEHLKELLEQYA